MHYMLALALFLVGVFGIFTQRNIIKLIVSVSIIENSVNLFLVLTGYRKDGAAPIITERISQSDLAAVSVDPFPQAMVLTSIVIGLSVLALMVALALRIYHRYGSYNIDEILKKQRGRG